MASEDQIRLSTYIRNVHNILRRSAKEKGSKLAWIEHLQNDEILKTYAKSMKNLSAMWETNALSSNDKKQCPKSRISWIIDYCFEYFFTEKIFLLKRLKEYELIKLIDSNCNAYNSQNYQNEFKKIQLLDVGSCFNPFKVVDSFNVTAIDLYPENQSVLKGDFLQISLGVEIICENNEVNSLPVNYFNCIVFSLLLEYLPTSEQRLLCCKKAYDLLINEGILIIITPDSTHVGKNAKLMKNWRYTLALYGFSRIKFEKLSHITCMVFRKSINKNICKRWSKIHKEDYMTENLEIPQD